MCCDIASSDPESKSRAFGSARTVLLGMFILYCMFGLNKITYLRYCTGIEIKNRSVFFVT